MRYFVYIIYSEQLSEFYVGETEDIDVRIDQHNTGYFKGSSTSRAKDWVLFLSFECKDRSQARKIESHIKRMRNQKYIKNLKQYPEIVDRLKERYS